MRRTIVEFPTGRMIDLGLAGGMSSNHGRTGIFNITGKVGHGCFESPRQCQQRKKSQIAIPSFDAADISAMETRSLRQVFLADFEPISDSAYIRRQSYEFVIHRTELWFIYSDVVRPKGLGINDLTLDSVPHSFWKEDAAEHCGILALYSQIRRALLTWGAMPLGVLSRSLGGLGQIAKSIVAPSAIHTRNFIKSFRNRAKFIIA